MQHKVKNTKTDRRLSQWLLCMFGGRSLLLSLLFIGLVCVVIKNQNSYHWVWNTLLKGNWEQIRKHPDLTLDQRYEIKLGQDYTFLNYIKNNTSDTAIILFPDKQVLTGKISRFQLGPNLTGKMWVTHFIYPRIPLYAGSADTNYTTYKFVTHQVILNEHGYTIRPVL